MNKSLKLLLGLIGLILSNLEPIEAQPNSPKNYETLVQLAQELRSLERTNLPNGVPDYRASTITQIQTTLQSYRSRHAQIDTSGWAIPQKVDYVLLWAEMNALDFNCRVLKPWERDPTFYAIIFTDQSDTPDHEGPTSFAAIELWKYNFPLTKDESKKLLTQLKIIPPLFEQARVNLTGNARDLWEVGIENIQDQINILDDLAKKTAQNGKEMKEAIAQAKTAATQFVNWLRQELPHKKGASGIGKEHYNWHLKNVLLTNLTWEDEVALLSRELVRSYASLQMERERNRDLPELKAYSSKEEYSQKTDLAVKEMMAFLQNKKILPVKAYMEPEMRKHLGNFVPEEKRNFFANISHRAPAVLYSHLTHWFEIAQLTHEPHPSYVRREALPYNMWMMRDEGLATGMEEILMQAGMWDNNPRARELVWIMLAQRCARGLASLYAHANQIDYAQARKFQVEWTPKGWTGDESLVGFEQHLYLRQPAYGTSYVSGKYLIEGLMMDVSRKQGNDFTLYKFFAEFYAVGIIPVSLVRWQMTGLEDEIKKIVGKF
ncbi:MAG: DUF885 family protein [Microscillaceae bacterium]|jgi:hypothetical protein|nr:DUF885 family protein [Microscillaceae bacterium]